MNKFQVSSNNVFGRYLVAIEDIKPGEIIFKDEAVVVGPKFQSELICLNCCKQIKSQFHCCSKCKLAPLCGTSCENTKGSHTALECETFSKLKPKLTVPMLLENLHLITVLRCILLKNQSDSNNWKRLITMESHLEKRRRTGIWKIHEKTSQVLFDLKIINEKDIESELVQKICGILDVNSFELRASDSQELLKIDSLCGVYPLAALMTHNCVSNTHLAIDNNFLMTVRASVPVEKGSPIFFNYTDVLQGTLNRREHLREGKYFECLCDRCKDYTELGLHLSSMKCLHCKNARVVMKKPAKSSQLTKSDVWLCLDCKRKCTGDEIKEILEKIITVFQQIDKSDPKSIEDFINYAAKDLNINHYIILDAKHVLAGLLRNILDRSPQQSKKMLLKKLEICKDFLPILDVLEPGLSRLKAITLYEMHIPIVQIANKEHDAKEITSVELLEKLESSEKCLKEAIRLLLFEPPSSPEGNLCKRAMDEFKLLKGAVNEARQLAKMELEDKKTIQMKRMKDKLIK
ncbi:SET domain-containing protein SmydA-8-like [Arctopsyche grandis]|uniref:SET domain-containing protein SmydA-8-like n=1 Tax=Arctopsyche grandis TaxID=121162 RepID=UPI00406D6FAF